MVCDTCIPQMVQQIANLGFSDLYFFYAIRSKFVERFVSCAVIRKHALLMLNAAVSPVDCDGYRKFAFPVVSRDALKPQLRGFVHVVENFARTAFAVEVERVEYPYVGFLKFFLGFDPEGESKVPIAAVTLVVQSISLVGTP